MAELSGLKGIPYLFLVLAIAGIIAGASMLSVGKFGDTMTQCNTAGAFFNTTYGGNNACFNSTNSSVYLGNTTTEFEATLLTKDGLSTVSEQFPTIGIIAIMVVIIGVLSSVFIYLAYFK